jgi:hypothetical protein
MPVQRKQQLLGAIETSEGVAASLSASDAVQVFEPSISDTVEVQDRVPAGPTLSRDFAPIGRQTRQVQFRSDFRGSGDTSIPVTEPDWAKFLQPCGYKTGVVRKLTCGAVTGSGFQVGEIVSQSAGAIRGVVLAVTRAGAPLQRATASGDLVVVATIVGTLTTAATTGESSASTSTMSAAAAHEGLVYQPTSEKLVNVTTGAWTGTIPAGAGEVLLVESPTGTPVGMVQVINNNGSMLDMDVTLLQGVMANGNTLRSAADGTATISAAPTQIRTPSLTIRHNLDGRQRDLLGARGDWTLEGESGQPMQFSWTFTGDVGPAVDAPAIATTGLSTIRPPRLLGAICAYGLAENSHRIATKRVSIANQGTVSPNLDANRAGGSTGSNITDRNPTITVTVDQVHGGFDWEAARDAGTVVRFAVLLGSALGNMMAVVAPICQVTEVALSDSDGIATFDVTLAPRRILESGDDDLFLAQI